MRQNQRASENDIQGINAIIEANQNEQDALYKYACSFDENENPNNSDRILFVAKADSTMIAFLSLH